MSPKNEKIAAYKGEKMIVDVRIVVEGISDAEMVSKAIEGLSLGSNYSITISSIIPTTVTDVARDSIRGADIVLVAMDADEAGEDHSERFLDKLKEEPTKVEKVKIPFKHDIEHLDVVTIRNSIEEALVRVGLESTQLIPENEEIKDKNRELRTKINNLKEKLEGKEEEETRLKVYNIKELWNDLFETEPPILEIREASGSLGIEGEILVGKNKIAATSKDIVKELFRTVYLANSLGNKKDNPNNTNSEEGKNLNLMR